MRSCAYRCRRIGVWPTGLQVFRTDGIKRKPDWSAKTRWAASLAAFFYAGPDGAFPGSDGGLVALHGPPFRFLVAPPQLVQELAHVVAMVAHPQAAFNQLGNPLRGPQLGQVAVRRGPFAQEPHEARFLLRREPGGPAGCRLGLQRRLAAGLQRIAPPENTAGVAPQAAGDLMKGQLLLEERDHSPPTLFHGSCVSGSSTSHRRAWSSRGCPVPLRSWRSPPWLGVGKHALATGSATSLVAPKQTRPFQAPGPGRPCPATCPPSGRSPAGCLRPRVIRNGCYFSVLSSSSWNSFYAWARTSLDLAPSMAFWMSGGRIEFTRRGRALLSEREPSTELEWYPLMRHCGVPTRLLDWAEAQLSYLKIIALAAPQYPCQGDLHDPSSSGRR